MSSEETISLGSYLFERLHQEPIGLKSIFGVPGDFNLTLLDKIDEVEGLRWRGNANELNAAYSADGYSRVKGGVSKNATGGSGGFAALVTTFGVGELSALNGVAGAYAEHVGLLHIVGIPSIAAQAKQLLLHHTLGNGDFTVFQKMSANISQTTGVLSDPGNATKEIDRCIREAYINQRPSYLAFPSNMVDVQVPKKLLDKPLNVDIPENDKSEEDEVIERTLEFISKAKSPVILIDACCVRHNTTREAERLIDLTNFKFAMTPMAKGSKFISEDHKNFAGIYVGSLSYPKVKETIESADLILSLGAMLSDFNTGSFSYSYSTQNVIEFHSDYTKIRKASYSGVRMKRVLQRLINAPNLGDAIKNFKPTPVVRDPFPDTVIESQSEISQEWLWTNLSKFLKKGDIIITETGTSSFGILQTSYPPDALGISQVLWGSIGYSVGALCGAAMAAADYDPSRRVILFVGDGSLQLTVQEISSMIRNGTKPFIFVLNNDGYTIERLIHGETAEYNDIQPWKHQNILDTFGAKDFESVKVSTIDEISKLFKDEKFGKNDKIKLIEVMLPKMDAPVNLVKQAELSAAANKS